MGQQGLQDVLKDLEEPAPEKVIKVEVDRTLERLMPKVLRLYEKFLSEYEFDWPLELDSDDKKEIWRYCNKIKFTPTPNVILEFTLQLADYQEQDGFEWVTGQYLSALVWQSHIRSHNNFNFEFRHLDKTVDYLLSYVGIDKRPLKVSILGNVGHFCGMNAKNLRLVLRGNADGQLAYNIFNSKIKVFGETDAGAGWCAENSVFKCADRESAERISKVVRQDSKVYWLKNGKKVLLK